MGSDYLYRPIKGTDRLTGWPTDADGHVLNRDDQRGGKARDLTSPYGSLQYAIGSGDDFWCFDYAVIEGQWVALHATINSETGSFIMDGEYLVVPVAEAALTALGLTDRAIEWCDDNGVRHTRKGWNQDERYFYRDVALATMPHATPDPPFTDRQRRFGGKRIAAITTL